jgi:hypothetical protein
MGKGMIQRHVHTQKIYPKRNQINDLSISKIMIVLYVS